MALRELLGHATRGPWGDPEAHLSAEAIERAFASLPAPPASGGRLEQIVARREGVVRESPARVTLAPERGVPGDAWEREKPDEPESQLAVMRADVARLLANGQPLTLFGDNLFVDLDLSLENLPPGSLLRAGGALLEVTPEPHHGCLKFRQRFGKAALRFTAEPGRRALRLRGIYMRVVQEGEVAVGDTLEVVSRAPGDRSAPSPPPERGA